MRAVLCGFCALLLGCIAPTTTRHWEDFSRLLSSDDLQQIKLLVAGRADIKQPVWQIATEEGRRDRARVSSGRWVNPGDESDYFQVEKHGRRWKIIPPIRHDRLKAENIITIS